MKGLSRAFALSLAWLLLPDHSASGLDIVLDVSGVGSIAITDNGSGDNEPTAGIIDFSETFGGQFLAEGRVRDAQSVLGRSVIISATPPATSATFRNTDSVDRDFTLTVNRTPFAEGIGEPLGWSIDYHGSADDPAPDVVNIPAHSVALSVNNPAVPLGAAVGTAITQADEIAVSNGAVEPLLLATSMQVIFTFTAGAGDEILLPQDELLDSSAILVRVFNQDDRCIDKMNNRLRKIAKSATKASEKCVKDTVSDGGGPSSPCTSALTSSKIDKAEGQVLLTFTNECQPIPLPAWGVNGETCCENGTNDGAACTMDSPDCDVGGACTQGACSSGAVERAVRDLGVDLFGASALSGSIEVGVCQYAVIKRAGRVFAERWKTFRKCKRQNLPTITDDASLISSCLGPPQVDTDSKIVTRAAELAVDVDANCIAAGVVPVGSTAFPGGACSAVPDANFAACVNARVACRFCRSVNVADAIDPPLDCDLFDDGSANSSCP